MEVELPADEADEGGEPTMSVEVVGVVGLLNEDNEVAMLMLLEVV